jgi:hypothetical protein
MATLRKDGSPVTVATWYLLDGDRIRVVELVDDTDRARARAAKR